MAETALTPIEIGLTAAIVGVEDGEPAILVAGDDKSDAARRTAVRPVRPAGAPHLRDRPARLGRGSRPACASAMSSSSTRSATAAAMPGPPMKPHIVSVGYLALTRIPERDRAQGGRARVSSRGIGSSRGRTGARSAPRSSTTSSPCSINGRARRMANSAARSAGASGCGSASASAARRGTRRRCSTATRCSTRPG